MPTVSPDPLLTGVRALIATMKVLFILGYAGLFVGTLAGVVGHGVVEQKVVAAGLPASAAWAIPGVLALLGLILLLAERFLRRLDEMLASVGAGDPFVPANAGRLEQMGWQSLAINLVAVPTSALAQSLPEAFDPAKSEIGFSVPTLVLSLVLFVLARVFRQGAAMRDELEGTI